MLRISIRILVLLLFCAVGGIAVSAQTPGAIPSLNPRGEEKEEVPSGVRDMLKKLEIEKVKKDFEEMQKRGKQVLELSDDLEKSIKTNNQFTEKDRAKLETLEKLVKKIRGELGGSDDAEPDKNDADFNKKPADVVEGLKFLRTSTIKLVEDLKKTTRFTVSLAAIQSSNAVLRLTRLLKFWK